MLQRIVRDGVAFYVSPLLASAGVPHAFSTRVGGISLPPFDSLNLGNPSSCDARDEDANIAENYRRLMSAAGLAGRHRRRVNQVHGDRVVRVSGPQDALDATQADALISDDATCALSVRVADCVPILLSSADGRVVAAVHAGWRGVIAGVVARAVEAMNTRDLLAAIGPCISQDAFEVGFEVIEAFERRFPGARLCSGGAAGKGHVDLRGAVLAQLREAGLRDDAIDTTGRCTFRDADEFFSHRRDRGVTGRHAAMIGARGSPSAGLSGRAGALFGNIL